MSSKGGDGHKGQDGGPGADAPDSSAVVSFFKNHCFEKRQGQPELYTTCPEICLPRKFTGIRTGIL